MRTNFLTTDFFSLGTFPTFQSESISMGPSWSAATLPHDGAMAPWSDPGASLLFHKLSVAYAESPVPAGQTSGAAAGGDIPGNTSTTATLAVGGSVVGTIDVSNDSDWFAIDLVAGQRYAFTLSGTGLNPLDDPYLEIMSSTGVQLNYNDDGPGDTLDSLMYFVPSQTGTYYLNAHGWVSLDDGTTSTGQYTLTAEEAPLTEVRTFDGVAHYLTDEYWSQRSWSDLSLTYDVQSLTPAQANLARMALATWASLTPLTFTEVTSDAQIIFTSDPVADDAESANTSTSVSQGTILHADINITDNWNLGDTSLDSYTYQTYLHEIGHALGLGHAGPYNGSAVYGQDNVYINDNWSYSVMSYFDQLDAGFGNYRFVLGPQVADILAIQSLYGANPAGTHTGNTVYGFNSTESDINDWSQFVLIDSTGTYVRPPSYAIYDTGGIDTIDLSGYYRDQELSLVPETFSSLGDRAVDADPTYTNTVSIARGTIIENAIGGSGNDTITGNSANNTLTGNAGNDRLIGGAGIDFLYGGVGSDTLFGGTENDYLYGDSHNDYLYGESGDDLLVGGSGIDFLYGGDGTDTLYGGTEGDYLYGDNQNDRLFGEAGNDRLIGGAGLDTIYGGDGIDVIYGGDDADYLSGDAQDDRIYGDGGNDP